MSKFNFSQVPSKRPKYNKFDLSHKRAFTFNQGKLIPIFCKETLPGETHRVKNLQQLLRFMPLTSPVMHQYDVKVHWFYTRNQPLWDGWQEFITSMGALGHPEKPYFFVEECVAGSILDYMGIPVGVYAEPLKVDDAIAFMAVRQIFDEYFRDQNLQTPFEDFRLVDGDNTARLQSAGLFDAVFPVAWDHDYFTSALPFPVRNGDVTIPLGTSAEIEFKPNDPATMPFDGSDWRDPYTGDVFGLNGGAVNIAGTVNGSAQIENGGTNYKAILDNAKNLRVNLTNAIAAKIRDLRNAFAVQEMLEKSARGGNRYNEHLMNFFGVKYDDLTLQRPKCIGFSRSNVMISEINQTSQTDTTPLGDYAGHGINADSAHGFSYTCPDYGWILGFITLTPKTGYFQGLARQFSRSKPLDYFYEQLAHIGEQEIRNKEIYAFGNDADVREQTFGYQERYAEYKYAENTVHGQMTTTMKHWHSAREFANLPVLSDVFIECNAPNRIFADTDPTTDKIIAYMHFDYEAIRPIPVFSDPRL